MIISERYRFAFVHIPKCAGTTVRNALDPYDDAAERFHHKGVATHPVLGPLDYPHIPLATLREHFAEDFSRLVAFQSFALVRDPRKRFPSSLHERLVQRDRRPLSDRAAAEVAREIDEVLDRLARHPKDVPITDPGLIHFSRQRDYIFLDGEQIVDTPRTVAEVDDLLDMISELIGHQVQPEESKNRRLQYAFPVVERLQRAVTRPIERALPRRIWKPAFKPIKQAFLAVGLIRHSGNPLSALPNAAEIDAFVAEFYAGDIELFARLDAERRARAEKGAVA